LNNPCIIATMNCAGCNRDRQTGHHFKELVNEKLTSVQKQFDERTFAARPRRTPPRSR
jgi:hypothetical protein